jgi:hypothetical protein
VNLRKKEASIRNAEQYLVSLFAILAFGFLLDGKSSVLWNTPYVVRYHQFPRVKQKGVCPSLS